MTALPTGLRGDYAAAAADYTIAQDHAAYAASDHATWRTLFARQHALAAAHAAGAFRAGIDRLGFAAGIPDFAALSAILRPATGWSVVAVPGLIPDAAFFAHLAARRFPCAPWIRAPEELDYIVEPDIFHDAFGHLPLLLDPDFADALAAYGRLGDLATTPAAREAMARLYWHMIEFGLVREDGGLRAYGAGILSSREELLHATTGTPPDRRAFALADVLGTGYRIDALQPVYFVIDDFAQLFAAMRDARATLTRSEGP